MEEYSVDFTNERNRQFKKTATVSVLAIIVYILVETLIQIVFEFTTETDFNTTSIIYTAGRMAAFVITFLVFFGKQFREAVQGEFSLGKQQVFDTVKFYPACITVNFLSLLVLLVTEFVGSRLGIGYDASNVLAPDYSGAAVVVDAIYSCILAPIVEELIYRGFLMGRLKKFGTKSAIIISAIMFSLMHGLYVQLPIAFFAGLVLGTVAVCTKSLTVPILLHMIYNTSISYGAELIGEKIFAYVYLGVCIIGAFSISELLKKYKHIVSVEQAQGKNYILFFSRIPVVLFVAFQLLLGAMYIVY